MSSTGGWQNWTSATTTLTGAATGVHRVYLTFTGTGGRLRQHQLVAVRRPAVAATRTAMRQAESYNSQSGTQLETTTDTGGGQNVGWIAPGDWLAYDNVDFGSTSPASVTPGSPPAPPSPAPSSTGSTARPARSSPASAMSSTGGWQTWTSATTLSGSATGVHTGLPHLHRHGAADFININWFQFNH